jgi:hypothetical protein
VSIDCLARGLNVNVLVGMPDNAVELLPNTEYKRMDSDGHLASSCGITRIFFLILSKDLDFVDLLQVVCFEEGSVSHSFLRPMVCSRA